MSPEEVRRFRESRFAEAAVALRRWDEEAKVEGLKTPNLTHFRPHLIASLRRPGS
jgi:predicted HD phosphohydrolase